MDLGPVNRAQTKVTALSFITWGRLTILRAGDTILTKAEGWKLKCPAKVPVLACSIMFPVLTEEDFECATLFLNTNTFRCALKSLMHSKGLRKLTLQASKTLERALCF